PMVATQAGAMPPSLMFNLLRGLDMVALITIWLVLGLSPWIGVVAAILAYSFLRMGGLDQQELQQMQEESRRQLAEQKRIAQNERPVRKKVVRR
ncbi:MAG: ABC transporter permease, partial [Cutibacterium granulosum]|nr:ABC transporter permease [Cutibacterium granulosum]